MRLFVSLAGSSVTEYKFDQGPVYVSRQLGCQVQLPDRSVSRQHAVFYTTKDGTWIIEDMGSSNKTYLNDNAVHKQELNHNDVVHISDYTIQVLLNEQENANTAMMEDTHVAFEPEPVVRQDLHTVERHPEAHDAPPIKFPGKRVHQYAQAMEILGTAKDINALHREIVDICFRHFKACHVWVSLRNQPDGPLQIQQGRMLNTQRIERLELAVPSGLDLSLEKHNFQLIHQLPRQITSKGIRSVLIAPIMKEKDCFGVVYIENSTQHPHYNLEDMDYLILLNTFIANAISRI